MEINFSNIKTFFEMKQIPNQISTKLTCDLRIVLVTFWISNSVFKNGYLISEIADRWVILEEKKIIFYIHVFKKKFFFSPPKKNI